MSNPMWFSTHGCTALSNLAHDDGAFDGQFEVHKGKTDNGDDTLHAVNLLTQEDVHGGQRAHLL